MLNPIQTRTPFYLQPDCMQLLPPNKIFDFAKFEIAQCLLLVEKVDALLKLAGVEL